MNQIQIEPTYCWTVCMTLDDCSFKFFKKLPAPPLIEPNRLALLGMLLACIWVGSTCEGGGGLWGGPELATCASTLGGGGLLGGPWAVT